MMRSMWVAAGALSVGLLAAGAGAAWGAEAGSPPPQHELLHYSVDLEVATEARYAGVWADVVQRRGFESFVQTYASWDKWLRLALPDLFGTPERAAATEAAWLQALQAAHPDAWAELASLSFTLYEFNRSEPLFQLPKLGALVSLYPLLNTARKSAFDTRPSACTSTLVRTANGSVLHGRSLDYDPRDAIAESTVVLDFHRRGKLFYRCLHPLVYITALQWFTCVRPGAFSLSANARSQGKWTEHNTSLEELLRRVAAPGAALLGEVAERAMESETYEAALEVLATGRAVSSNYFILAGTGGRGAVVTRFGNSSVADVWALGSPTGLSDGQPPWLRVQTNVDHWVPFSSSAYATHRRQQAVDLLTGLGQAAVDKEALLGVYLTDTARAGSENRTRPEDTGVILRPSTIATVVLDPEQPLAPVPDPHFWRIWARSPVIRPPAAALGLVVV